MAVLPFLPLFLALFLLVVTYTRRSRTCLKLLTETSLPDRRVEMKRLSRSHLPTQHKRSKKKRKEKREIGRLEPYAVLRLLYNANLPENKREALATLLPTFAKNFCYDNRARTDRVCDMMWEELPVETNPMIRRPLMLLANSLFQRTWDWNTDSMRERIAAHVLDIITQDSERCDMRYDVREVAYEMLAEMLLGRYEAYDIEPYLEIWRRILDKQCKHHTFSDRLMGSAVHFASSLIRERDFPRGTCPPVALWYAADRATMGFLFKSLLSESASLRVEPCWSRGLRCRSSAFLSTLLKILPGADRITFLAEYGVQLRNSLSVMHPSHITEFAEHDEFLDIIATTPAALINVWEGGGKHKCNGSWERRTLLAYRWTRCRERDTSNVIFWSLQHALRDPPRLQSMLGEGFITIAHHYASNEFDTSPHVANVFRRILTLHPELEPRFKEVARFGIATNQTAVLARSLIERPCKVGWYIWEEEVETSSSEEDSEADSDDHNDETRSEESGGSDEDSYGRSSLDSEDVDDGESSNRQDSDDVE